jgi:hypothetical protein
VRGAHGEGGKEGHMKRTRHAPAAGVLRSTVTGHVESLGAKLLLAVAGRRRGAK